MSETLKDPQLPTFLFLTKQIIMKYVLLVLLILFGYRSETITAPIEQNIVVSTRVYFPSIYQQIRKYEGNYVWHKSDKGGETYGGITRKYSPDWYGWRYIKGCKTNQICQEAEYWVQDYYLTLWVREGFDTIEDYDLALNLFDFRIHVSPKTYDRKINKILKDMNSESIECSDPVEFVWRLKMERVVLYSHLAMNDSSQRVFYKGWLKRVGI